MVTFLPQGFCRLGPADERVSWSAMHDPRGRVRWPVYVCLQVSRLCFGFDVDLPTETDDEYWESEQYSDQAFKHPPGKHSLLSHFACFIKIKQLS
jgi:hypothetical protein